MGHAATRRVTSYWPQRILALRPPPRPIRYVSDISSYDSYVSCGIEKTWPSAMEYCEACGWGREDDGFIDTRFAAHWRRYLGLH